MSAIVANDGGGSQSKLVELRVHGVSGTPAEQMLSCPSEYLDRIWGDKAAGFYKCRPCGDDTDAVHAPHPTREAYSWGGLTSGAVTRGLWLLFLPFVLVNLAHWMLPPASAGPKAAERATRMLRLLALSLTLTFMLASVQIVVDVVGWQCVAIARCGEQLGPLSGLTHAREGLRIAVTAAPVAVLLGLVLLLGRANPAIARRVAKSGKTPKAPGFAFVEANDLPLRDPNFFNPDDSVKRMRGCHVTAWLSGLASLIAAVPVRYIGEWTTLRGVCLGLASVNALALLTAVCLTWSTASTGRGGTGEDESPDESRTKWVARLARGSIVLCAGTLVVVGFTRSDAHLWKPTHLPMLRDTIYTLLVIQTGIVAACFLTTAQCIQARRTAFLSALSLFVWPLPELWRSLRGRDSEQPADDGWSPSLGGFVAPVVATIALLAAGGFSSGVGLWGAQVFGTPVPTTRDAQCLEGFRARILESSLSSTDVLLSQCTVAKQNQLAREPTSEDRIFNYDTDAPLIVPPGYFVAALVFFGLLVVPALTAVRIWFCVIPQWQKTILDEVVGDYDVKPTVDDHVKAVARGRALALLTDRAPAIVARLTWVAVFAMVSIGVPFALIEHFYGFQRVPITVPVLSTLSVAAIAGTAAGLVGLALGALRNRQQRRTIGILWDVITFWPRANHPLTPPCYAERTVPDLCDEIRYLLEEKHKVVLSAHSQGTIIAAASLLQLKEEGHNVALLTFGSPLRRLYGRNFPAYFGEKAMAMLETQHSGRWLNLWAHTDPIGGWVLRKQEGDPWVKKPSGGSFTFDLNVVDHRLLDACSVEILDRGGFAPICGHSGFWTRAEYKAAIAALGAVAGIVDPATSGPEQTTGTDMPN